jgi:hypothetical protein
MCMEVLLYNGIYVFSFAVHLSVKYCRESSFNSELVAKVFPE